MSATAADLDDWFERVDKLPEPDRSRMLAWVEQQVIRERSLAAHSSPADLAAALDPEFVITPAIELIGRELERAISTRRGRLLITMPPQEGKSTLTSVWTPIRALQRNPSCRTILASFSQGLAEEQSSRTRAVIAAHGTGAKDPLTQIASVDELGIGLAYDKAAASHWRIQGHKGGMVAVGLGGTIAGRPADLLIIDDPLKGMEAADSVTERRKVIAGFQGDLTTRLAPGAPIILIQTRWHEDDLAGWILKHEAKLPPEKRRWRHINIPALSEAGLLDSLGREPGTWLKSSRDRTSEDWEETRDSVGPRVWSALYQGTPTPTGGGLFNQAWFDKHRASDVGPTTVRVVSIDPAETGRRDEAGIVAAAATPDGRVLWTDDWSGRMTSDQWARRAVLLALKTSAHEVAFEAYTTEQTYRRVIATAWKDVRDQARLLRASGGDVDVAAGFLGAEEDSPDDPVQALSELSGIVVPDVVEPPFTIHPYRGKGDKVARATGARQAASTGRLRIVGTLTTLERQAVTWQQGQSSPDRMDAAVNGYERVIQMIGGRSVIASPADVQATPNMAGLLSSPMSVSGRA